MTMALGSCQIHSRPSLALCFAGLLLISAGSPCDARRLLLSESEKHPHKLELDSNVIIEVLIMALLTLLVALALLRQCRQCCRSCGSPVGHAEEEAVERRSSEFSSKLFGALIVVKGVQVVLSSCSSPVEEEENDPKSIPPTMVRSPCGSPEPRHWVRHVSPVTVRHHHREPSGGQQNPAPATATDSFLRDIAPVSQGPLKEFSYFSLAKATRDFDKGNEFRSGMLYAGHLLFDDGLPREVAIKRFHKNLTDDGGQIRQDLRRKKYMLQHRNLVTLFGYCLHDGKLFLVYDWMHYHNLDYELFGEKDYPHRTLTLAQRHDIIRDAARGLLQLHDRNAFHGAVKSSNIMLEPSSRGFRARLADFRYSKLLAEEEGSKPATGTLSSLLYPDTDDPEWTQLSADDTDADADADADAASRGPSLETDVLHFAGMMLEVLCGRRLFARDDQLPLGHSSLLDWVQELDGEAQLDAALDENAKKAPDFNEAQAEALLRLSLRCSNPDPGKRPTIRTILEDLSKEVQTEISPRHVRTTGTASTS